MVVGLGPHGQPDGVEQAQPAAPTPAPGGSASPPVLRFTNVSKFFGSVKAVDDVSFDIHRGEFFTLLGPSGCGKTTSLRIVGGLEHPDDGEVALRGNLVAAPRAGIAVSPDRRNLGMVFQSYAIWPHMTVFENVAYPLTLRRLKGAVIRDKVERVLDVVGLQGLEQRPATLLSGGQQQRLALCRALVYEPDVLLLDEPFSNLDAKLREQMRLELKQLHRRLQITVLFVTHDQIEALSLSDRIAVMHLGRVEQLDTPRVLYDAPRSAIVRDFLGRTLLLSGHVQSLDSDGHAAVQVDGLPAEAIVTGTSITPAATTKGAAVTVAIRPEVVSVRPSDDGNPRIDIDTGEDARAARPGASTLAATVESSLFVGDHYQVNVVLDNHQELLLTVPRAHEWAVGTRVWLYLPTTAVSVWPA